MPTNPTCEITFPFPHGRAKKDMSMPMATIRLTRSKGKDVEVVISQHAGPLGGLKITTEPSWAVNPPSLAYFSGVEIEYPLFGDHPIRMMAISTDNRVQDIQTEITWVLRDRRKYANERPSRPLASVQEVARVCKLVPAAIKRLDAAYRKSQKGKA